MKYTIVFGLLALMLGWLAIDSAGTGLWWLAAIEGYLAAGLLGLAIAYGLRLAGFAVEEVSRHPRARFFLSFVLTPYRGLAWLAMGATRRGSREPGISRVAPGLAVGRYPTRSERRRLPDDGIDAVLNLCAEFPVERAQARLCEAYVPILDGSPPNDRQFREAVEWVLSRHLEGKSVLIHCAQGHGRSATVAAVVLCRLGLAGDLDQAIGQIKMVRPKARPSKGQRASASRFLASFGPGGNAKRAGLSTDPLA